MNTYTFVSEDLVSVTIYAYNVTDAYYKLRKHNPKSEFKIKHIIDNLGIKFSSVKELRKVENARL